MLHAPDKAQSNSGRGRQHADAGRPATREKIKMPRGKGHKPDFVHVGVSVIFLCDQPETVSPKERETGRLVVSYLILLRMGLALRSTLTGAPGGLLHRLFTLTTGLAA